MNKKRNKSWVDKKLSDPSFRKKVEQEYERLSIGEELLRLRLEAKLTQAQVAKKIGTTASAISRYENAQYDKYEVQTLKKIAAACNGTMLIQFISIEDEEVA